MSDTAHGFEATIRRKMRSTRLSQTRIRVFLARRTNTHVRRAFHMSATGSIPTPTVITMRRSAHSLASSISLGHAVFSTDLEDSSAMEDIPRLTRSLHTFPLFPIPTQIARPFHDGGDEPRGHSCILRLISRPYTIRVFEESASRKAFGKAL